LYEALEAGTLPVTTITERVFLDRIEQGLGLSSLYPWTEPEKAMRELTGEKGDQIQKEVRERWIQWKESLRKSLTALTADPSS
jgi:hypothetical protein